MPAQKRLRLALTLSFLVVGVGCSARSDDQADDTAATAEETAAAASADEEAVDEEAAPEESPAAPQETSAESDSLPTPRLTSADLDIYLRGKRVENPEFAKRCKEYTDHVKGGTATTVGMGTTLEKMAAMSEEEMNKIGARAAGVDVRRYKAIGDAVDRVLFLWGNMMQNRDTLRLAAAARDSLRRELIESEGAVGETDSHNAAAVLARSGELFPVFAGSRGATLGLGCLVGK
jgi:hypothetical protein